MRFILTSLYLALSTFTFSQAWIWDSAAIKSEGNRLCKDGSGHLYSYQRNGFKISKITANNTLLWQVKLDTMCRIKSLCYSPDSTIYVLSEFSDTVTVANNTFISKGPADFLISRLDDQGNFLWTFQGGGKGNDQVGGVGMQGKNLLLVGSARDTIHFKGNLYPKQAEREIYVARIFPNGNLDIIHILPQSSHYFDDEESSSGLEICADQAGDIIALTRLTGTVQVGTTLVQDYMNYHVIKFTNNLQHVWLKDLIFIGWSTHDYAKELTIGKQDEIYLSYTRNGNHMGTGFIFRIPANGSTVTPIYQTPMPSYGEYGQFKGLDTDTCGNLYFTGYYNNWYGAFPIPYYLINGQFSPAGNLNWVREDSAYAVRYGEDIQSLALNKCFVTINYTDTFQIQNTIHVGPKQGYGLAQVNAIIQNTFGVPWNTTPLVNTSICANNSTTLVCSTGGAINWYASPTATNSVYTGNNFNTGPLAAGVYTWYAEATTCTMVSAKLPVTVTVNPPPVISVPDGTICAGDQFVLNPSPSLTYSYSSINPTVFPLTTSTYSIFGYDSNNCIDTAVCNVHVKPTPSIFIQPSQNPVCKGVPVTFSLSGASTFSMANLQLSNPFTLTPSSALTMMVSATGANGCTSATIFQQNIADCTGLTEESDKRSINLFPNPTNGVLNIQTSLPASVSIINCIGQTVYHIEISDHETRLDLTFLQEGVYFIKSETANEKTTQKIVLKK